VTEPRPDVEARATVKAERLSAEPEAAERDVRVRWHASAWIHPRLRHEMEEEET
jgi:hypothetical protein